MRKVFLSLILGLVFSYGYAQSIPRFFYKYYQGTIGNSTISLHLQHQDGELSGYYYYDKAGRPLSLSGSMMEGEIELEEYALPILDESTTTGKIRGEWGYGNQISGTWYSPDSSRQLPLILHEKKPPVPFEPIVREFMFRKITVGNAGQEDVKAWEFPVSYWLLEPTYSSYIQESVQDSIRKFTLGCSQALSTEVCLNQRAIQLFTEATAESELPSMNFESEQRQQVLFQNQQLLVIKNFSYSYWGGAHGMYSYLYSNIDLNSGKQLRLSDIFSPESIEKLAEYISAQARIPTDLSEVKSGLQQFYLSPGGLGLVFNVYSIASYADGVQEFYFTWEELEKNVGSVATARSYVN